MKLTLLQFLLLLFCYNSIFSQNFNRPVPTNFPPYEFKINATPINTIHYLLTPTPFSTSINYGKYLTLLNNEGYIKWYSDGERTTVLNFQYHPNQNLFSYASRKNGTSRFIILNSSLNKIDSIQPINGVLNDVHELIILDNGNYVVAGSKKRLFDLSSFSIDGSQGSDSTYAKGFVFQEFDVNHNLIFEWNSNDHIHPSEYAGGYQYNVNNFDYAHGNAIEEDVDGNFLLSFRHLDAIYKINKATGDIMWILGGNSNQFTFTNDSNQFSGQHDIRVLPNGNITIFNNDNKSNSPHISTGVEYELNLTNMTCSKTWEYTYDPSFFSRAMGNFRTLNNQEKIIGFGSNLNSTNPNFLHLDASDNIKTELFFEDSIISYRALIADLPFTLPSPIIDCSGGNGTIILTAEFGYDDYIWSTGDSTQSIIVSDTGTYQVWVNYGIGMLGSDPIYITDLQTPCNTSVGVNKNPQSYKQKKIIAIYDLLGREILQPKLSHNYIVKFDDNTTKLVFWNNNLLMKN